MDGLGSSNWMSVSNTQQGSDGQMGAEAPAETLSSIESSLTQGLRSSGDPSHFPHIDQNFECHGEPAQPSCFTRVGQDVRPLDRIPDDAGHEVTAATAQPSTPVHWPRYPAQIGGEKTRKVQRRPRIKLRPVKHTEQNDGEIQKLEPYLRSLIRYHFGNSEALQVFALNRILEHRQQRPPIHICRVERKNGDPRGMILLVICLLCPPGPEAPSPFKEPNALPKFAHHFRTFHCNIKNPFACVVPPCERSFSLRHDMTRHIKTAHPEFDGPAGGIKADIPDPVVASNATGPSNTSHAFNELSPVVVRHNISSSTAGPSRRTNPYPLGPIVSLFPNQDWDTMNAVAGSSYGAGPSAGHQAGYMAFGNAGWVGHPSPNHSTMSFHDAHGESYGRLSHIAAPGANVPADYLRSHTQMMESLYPFLLNRNPGGVPSGTPLQIQSHQSDSSTGVAQMALTVESNHRIDTRAGNHISPRRQNRMPSSAVRGSHQPMSTQAPAKGVTQRWYDPNTHHAQALHHQMDEMSAGLADLLGEPRYMPPSSQDLSTSSQARYTGFIQQQQQQHQHLTQNQVNTAFNNNQHTPYLPWGPPQNSLDVGSWTLTRPLNPRYPRTGHHSQTDLTRTKPPRHLGENVSLDRKTLKGRVGKNFRNFLSWLGLIGLMVGVSEAFLSAILVYLTLPGKERDTFPLSESGGEAHNECGRFGDGDYAACYRHPTTRLLTYS